MYFKVEKSWIQDKNIDLSSITLNRYNDTKWDALPTSLSGEDEKYLYFAANTTGFSPFAITGNVAAEEAANETQSQSSTLGLGQNNLNNAINVEQPEQTQSPKASGKGNTKSPGFEAFCGIFTLLVVFMYKKR